MKLEETVFGLLSVFWGVLALLYRKELYLLAREGGRGLRDIRLLRPAILIAASALLVVGAALFLYGVL